MRFCNGLFFLRRVFAILLVMVIALPSVRGLSEPKPFRIAIFSFAYPTGNEELKDFAKHADKTLRAAMTSLNDVFSLEPDDRIDSITTSESLPTNEALAVALAAKAGCDMALFGLLEHVDGHYLIKAGLLDVNSGRPAVMVQHKAANIHELPSALNLFQRGIQKRFQNNPAMPLYRNDQTPGGTPGGMGGLVALNRNLGEWRSPEIPSAFLGVDIGDLDGDKQNETVFLEESGITICRFEQGGLKQLTQFSQLDAQHIFVETEDLDGDGIAEIILVCRNTKGFESWIFKYINRNLTVTAKIPDMILRTIRELDEPKRILVGQRTDVEDIFTGEMVRLKFENNSVVQEGTISLPPGTLLTGYDSGFPGIEKEFVRVIMNQDRRLLIFDKENRLLGSVTGKVFGGDRKIKLPGKGGVREIALPGRVLIRDTRGDGESEILVIGNNEGGNVVQSLTRSSGQTVEKWHTIQKTGLISDFALKDIKNEGRPALVFIVVKSPSIIFGTQHSVIFAYDLRP